MPPRSASRWAATVKLAAAADTRMRQPKVEPPPMAVTCSPLRTSMRVPPSTGPWLGERVSARTSRCGDHHTWG